MTSAPSPVRCTSCDGPAEADDRFCGTCGSPLGEANGNGNGAVAAPLPAVAPRGKVVISLDDEPAAAPVAISPPPPPASAAKAAAVAPPPPPPPMPAKAPVAPPDWQRSLPAPYNGIPVELLLVCVLMAAAGLLVLWPVVTSLPAVFDAIGQGGLARSLGLLLLSVWLLLGLFGAACLRLAWRLARGDRVARGLTYVLCGGLGASVLLGDQKSTSLVLVMLACFAVIGVLAATPRVKEFFAGDPSEDQEPVPVVVARTLLAYWASCMTLVGVTFLPLSGLGSKYLWIGALLIGLGVGAFYLNRRLSEGDATARTIVSAGAGFYLLLSLVLGRADPGLLVPVAIAVGIVWNLWAPPEAQRHFGTAAGSPRGL